MLNIKFKKIFELSQKLQEKNDKELYDELSKIDNKIGSFEEFVKSESLDKELSNDSKKKAEDAYILKDKIIKDTLIFDLYLFHYNRIDPIKLDENYKPLPLNKKGLYEYGAIVSMEDEEGYYGINGIFGGIEDDEHFARDKYNVIKNKIENASEEELLNEIEKQIQSQMND